MSAHADCPHCSNRTRRILRSACWWMVLANVAAWSILDVAALSNNRCAQAEYHASSNDRAVEHAVSLDDRLHRDEQRAREAGELEREIPVRVVMHPGTLTFAGRESITRSLSMGRAF
jgi:hypothetical protein